MKKIIISILLILSYNSLFSIDTNYVKPEELEPGWGLYWTNLWTEEIPEPKTMIFYMSLSPDGKWIVYGDDYCMKLLNLESKELINIDIYGDYSDWSSSSDVFGYNDSWHNISIFYNIFNGKKDSICCPNGKTSCSRGGRWAPDGYGYFTFPDGYPPKDSIPYRCNIDSSRKVGYPIDERFTDNIFFGTYTGWPVFPPLDVSYYVAQYYDYSVAGSNPYLLEGFDVVTDWNCLAKRRIIIPVPDTSWVYDGVNTAGSCSHSNLIEVGPRGDVYLYLSYRSKAEKARHHAPPFDSADVAARNACGWYRVDTTGANLVQLVRSWTYTMGGLAITGDGETIYYGMLDPDTCAAIYKMDRFGKNKQRVLKIVYPTSVNELPVNNNSVIIKPNPFEDYFELDYNTNAGLPYSVEVFNMLGEAMYSQQGISKNIRVNTSGFPEGIYYIVVKDISGAHCCKAVKVR